MFFPLALIALGVVGLVLDDRGDPPPWVPGGALACLGIGLLLALGRLARGGARGFGFGLAGTGAAALATERMLGWAPADYHTALTVGSWVVVAAGVLIWVGGMWTEHESGGLAIALTVVAVVSLVSDAAFGLPSPWDGVFDVLTTAAGAGALSAGLAWFGSMSSDDDLLATSYAWLTSAVVAGLGLSVTALVAAAAFKEPAWVLALLVILVVIGVLGAAAAVVMGARYLSRYRREIEALQRLQAEEAARRRLRLDEDEDADEEIDYDDLLEEFGRLAGDRPGRVRERSPGGAPPDPRSEPVSATASGPVSAPESPAVAPRRRWLTVPAMLGFVADTIAIVTVLVAAVHYLLR